MIVRSSIEEMRKEQVCQENASAEESLSGLKTKVNTLQQKFSSSLQRLPWTPGVEVTVAGDLGVVEEEAPGKRVVKQRSSSLMGQQVYCS